MKLVTLGDVDLEVEVVGDGEPVVVVQTALSADELQPLAEQTAFSGDYQVTSNPLMSWERATAPPSPSPLRRRRRRRCGP